MTDIYPYNRTMLELKHPIFQSFCLGNDAYNRTMLELKQPIPAQDVTVNFSYNRTMLELKPNSWCRFDFFLCL